MSRLLPAFCLLLLSLAALSSCSRSTAEARAVGAVHLAPHIRFEFPPEMPMQLIHVYLDGQLRHPPSVVWIYPRPDGAASTDVLIKIPGAESEWTVRWEELEHGDTPQMLVTFEKGERGQWTIRRQLRKAERLEPVTISTYGSRSDLLAMPHNSSQYCAGCYRALVKAP